MRYVHLFVFLMPLSLMGCKTQFGNGIKASNQSQNQIDGDNNNIENPPADNNDGITQVPKNTQSSQQPKCNLTATPSTVAWGNPITLSWSSTNANSASLNHNIGSVPLSSSKTALTLVNGTQYKMSVTGPNGSTTCSTTVTVVQQPPPLTTVIDTNLLGLPPLNYVQGPIVIDGQSGVVISGQAIYNHNGPCLIIRNSSNITITQNQFFECGTNYASPDGAILQVLNSSYISVDHNFFSNGGPNSLAVLGQNNAHVNVSYNQFYNVAGGVSLWGGTAQNVTYNRFQNMFPRAGSLSGFIQFVQAYGGLNTIACNTGSNEPSVVPQTGDLINIYMSNGVPHSPIQVYGNKLIGTGTNLDGPGLASAGIQTGDGSFSSHINVFFNQIVNLDAAIGVSGGDTIEVSNNRIYSGGRMGYYTSGIGVVNFYGVPNQVWTKPGAFCRNVNLKNNSISMGSDSQSRAYMVDFSNINNWPNCENVVSTNNDLNAILDTSIVNGNPAPGCSQP